MIKISNLTHMYGTNKALNNVDLEINRGEIFGLIGHNGAGKSTAIKALVSILEPTSGDIFIDGKDLKTHRLEIKRQIGYVADSPDMFLEMQAIDSAWIPPSENSELMNFARFSIWLRINGN